MWAPIMLLTARVTAWRRRRALRLCRTIDHDWKDGIALGFWWEKWLDKPWILRHVPISLRRCRRCDSMQQVPVSLPHANGLWIADVVVFDEEDRPVMHANVPAGRRCPNEVRREAH